MNPEDLSLTEAASQIRAGELSPVRYAQALFSRIDRIEPRLRSWVTVDRGAVFSEAERCEEEAARKEFRGALHGMPVGIKDIFYTKNLRTTMGSGLFENHVPDHDAAAVRKLKEAGAIVLGKTVTTLFANLDPGPTRNPWNLEHTPGGSSSGSATAVAARMCPAAIGTQTVGSVSRPAAFNGIVSIVPTQKRVSLAGVFPLAWSLDHVGLFGRSVADVELMLDVMTELPIEKTLPWRTFRIGIIRDFFYENASPEAQSLQDRLAAKLSSSGFHVDEAPLPAIFSICRAVLRTIVRSEAASVHERQFRQHPAAYREQIRTLVETGMLVNATDYLLARRLRRQYQRDMARLFDRFDLLITPAARGTAPEGIDSTGDPVMNGPWTLADFPTITLPCELGSSGLPLGVQLSAAPMQEGPLIEMAKAVEAVVCFIEKPRV